MVSEKQKRLLELYEKGVLTKEEAKACFMELDEEVDYLFVEEKAHLTFTLPSLKVFSSNKLKQNFRFTDIESMNIRLREGKVSFHKNKGSEILFSILYPQKPEGEELPQIYVEKKALHFAPSIPCQLTVLLPERWMSVLDLEIGQADARLDYLPFEDVSIHSHSDKKQQDIRVTSYQGFSQHLHFEVMQAPIHMIVSKHQGLKGRFESSRGTVEINRKKKTSPYLYEKAGEKMVYLQVHTDSSPLIMKGMKHVRIL